MHNWQIILCSAVVILTGCERPREHRLYGPIRQTTGCDYGWLLRPPRPTVFAVLFGPQKPKPVAGNAHLLKLDNERMEWAPTDPEKRIGVLHFWEEGHDVPADRKRAVWEFALSSRRKLEEILPEDLGVHFYGADTPGWKVALSSVSDNRFRVVEGQVLLARHREHPETVFGLELTKQQGLTLTVRYLSIKAPRQPTEVSPPAQH